MYEAQRNFLNQDGSINMSAALAAGRRIRSETAYNIFRKTRQGLVAKPKSGIVATVLAGLWTA